MTMAGSRLEYWSTLDGEELRSRVGAELERTGLTFAETQLLEAAQRRLCSWRAPSNRRRAMIDDTETAPDTTVDLEIVEEKKEPVKKRKAKKAKDAPEETAIAATEETTVQETVGETDEGETKVRTAKKAKKAPAKKAAKKAKKAAPKKTAKKVTAKRAAANGANGRVNLEDVVRWKKGAENPFREGSGAYKRTEIVKSNSGSTRKSIQSKAIKGSTIATLARMGLVEIDKTAD
jgi:membrane protein involved in colicin uptake